MIPFSIALIVVAVLGYRAFTLWLSDKKPSTPSNQAVQTLAEHEGRIRILEAKAGLTRRPFSAGDVEP